MATANITSQHRFKLQYANKLLITYIPADHNCIELHRCKQHNAINGYNYRAFFKLHELDHHNPANADLIVDLLVYVLAARDGHILLSEQNKTAPTALEIGNQHDHQRSSGLIMWCFFTSFI